MAKGSIGRAFAPGTSTEGHCEGSFYPFVPHEISVLIELPLGHLRYRLTGMPPQPNSPTDDVFCARRRSLLLETHPKAGTVLHRISKTTLQVVVFQVRFRSHLFYTS